MKADAGACVILQCFKKLEKTSIRSGSSSINKDLVGGGFE